MKDGLRIDGQKIERLRCANHWTQLQMAERSKMGLRQYCRYEQNQVLRPSYRAVNRIAAALQVPVEALVEEEEE